MYGDMNTYVVMSADGGITWKKFSSSEFTGFAHIIREDIVNEKLLFLGTEMGLFISLDGGNTRTTKEQWLKAVEDDKLAWTQVSDMQGWNNEVSTAWGIRSIPANFLVDPNGKIVAKDLRGGALHKKLAELLDKKTK